MRRRPKPFRTNPRVRIVDHDRDGYGRTTLSGINYQDLRQILTGAALHYHDELAKSRDKDSEAEKYARDMLRLVSRVESAVTGAIMSTHPLRVPTRRDRWQTVKEERKERIFLDQICDQFFAPANRGK